MMERRVEEKPTTKTLQIRLFASNLPRRRRGLLSTIPSTYCAVTSLTLAPPPEPTGASSSTTHLSQALTGIENENYSERSTSSGVAGHVWGKTEVIQSRNPQWTKSIFVEYTEGTLLHFYVHVFSTDEPQESSRSSLDFQSSLGAAAMEVSDILGTEHSTRAKRLRRGGCIFCRIEVAKIPLDCRCRLQFSAELIKGSRSMDVWIEVSKSSTANSTASTWFVVYRSNVETATSSYSWDVAEIDLGTLCNGDLDKPLRISLQRRARGSPILIGMAETTLRHLVRLSDPNNVSDMDIPSDLLRPNELYLQQGPSQQQRQRVGKLQILEAYVDRPSLDENNGVESPRADGGALYTSKYLEEQATRVVDLGNLQQPSPPVAVSVPSQGPGSTVPSKTFQDYCREGCVLDLCVAIDYTSSNGAPSSTNSLHHQSSSYNDYEESILAIGAAIDPYSSKEHSVWGFGAKFQDGVVRHLFQCGLTPKVIGTQGILEAYRQVFRSDFIMSGPTVLLQVIQAAALQAKRQHTQMTNTLPSPDLRYTVLLIITDGAADEFEETKRKLAVYGQMPLSVVIVGVGNSPGFTKMQELCQGLEYRPNTTFIEFRAHQHDPSSLGVAALKNIPDQVCEYMHRRGF